MGHFHGEDGHVHSGLSCWVIRISTVFVEYGYDLFFHHFCLPVCCIVLFGTGSSSVRVYLCDVLQADPSHSLDHPTLCAGSQTDR